MRVFAKERAAVADAAGQLKDSSQLLLAAIGVAVVIATIALVVAVVRK